MLGKVVTVDIKFGYSCNNNCVHCVIAGHKERLRNEGKPVDRTTDEIMGHLTDAKRLGATSVVFTGGEVTIRSDYFELLKFAADLGLFISLQTNGRSFCFRDFAKRTLIICPNMHFEIAIHSDNAARHDAITRAKGSFEQTLAGIKNLKEVGAKSLNFKVVISKLNFRSLPAIIDLARICGAKQVDIAYPHGMGNALKYWHEIIPRYSEISEYLLAAARVGISRGIAVTYEAVPFCFLAGFETCVSELHYLRGYSKGETSSLRQVGDPEIDWQRNRISIKAKSKNCTNCKFFNICEGVWKEYLEKYGSEELKPVFGRAILTYEGLLDCVNNP
ncbi:MAG: radical SAM protein [Candidatus Aenigmarchaeota archaeon]|nr:radical SAM protein [Candidatus Aenigmarchaeota archaeon]